VHPVNEELLEQVFRDVALVPEEFPEDTFVKLHVLERFPVIHIARGKDEIQDLSPVVDYQVELEAVEPADGALPLLRHSLERPVLLLSFYMATAQRGGVNERDARALAQAHHLDEDGQRNANLPLQLHETIIGNSVRKISLHMLLNIKNIEAFQILERPAVKQDQDGHHLAPGHREFPVPFLDFRVRQRVLSDHVIKFFEKLVDNEINFCNFMVWNHSGIISVLFSFQRFKTTNFFAIFLLFIHFSYIELTLRLGKDEPSPRSYF
jgi:hypothetical protein